MKSAELYDDVRLKVAASREALLAKLATENKRMKSALEQAEEYFDGKADVVDGSYGEPSPNREMQILNEIREALGTSR